MESKLVEKVIHLLKSRNHGVSFREISEKTSIPEGWITRLQQGKIKEPSAPRCEKLYEYLSGKKLVIE